MSKIVLFQGRHFQLMDYDRPEHFLDPRAEEYFEIEKNKLYRIHHRNMTAVSSTLIGIEITQSIQFILED